MTILITLMIGFLLGAMFVSYAWTMIWETAIKKGSIIVYNETYRLVPHWKDKPIIDGDILEKKWS